MSELFAALLQDTVGRWFLYFGALVFFGILAVLAFLSVRKTISKAVTELGVIRHEVKNDHSTNLRVEADERHDENARKLDWLIESVRGIQLDVRNLYSRDQAHDDDIRRIEHTLDRRPDAPQ